MKPSLRSLRVELLTMQQKLAGLLAMLDELEKPPVQPTSGLPVADLLELGTDAPERVSKSDMYRYSDKKAGSSYWFSFEDAVDLISVSGVSGLTREQAKRLLWAEGIRSFKMRYVPGGPNERLLYLRIKPNPEDLMDLF